MKTLQISDNLARQIYPSADTQLKSLLEENFGKLFFSQKITEKIKTFEDACEILGDEDDIICQSHPADEVAYAQLKVIVKALNEGWQPDWNNSNQYKYYPWFVMEGGFRFDDVHYHCTGSLVGSRLCFKSRELAEYAGKTFKKLYEQYFLLK